MNVPNFQIAQSRHFQGLTGLRGVLAMWVLIYHILTISNAWALVPDMIGRYVAGDRAVDVFIIISGFVITKLLREGREGYREYLFRRALRLYPTFLICIFIALIAQYLGLMPRRVPDGMLPAYLVSHSVLLFGALPEQAPGSRSLILNPAWSVSLEWQFYLVAPLLVWPLARGRRGLMWITITCLVVSRLLTTRLEGFDGSFLPFRLHYFWIGIVSYELSSRRLRACLPTDASVSLLITLLAAEMIFLPLQKNVGLLIWTFAFPFILANDGRGSFLTSRTVAWLGAVSFPLYLCHEPIIWACNNLHIRSDALRALAIGVAVVPAALLVSGWIHKHVELPAIAFGKRIVRRAES